MYIVEVAQSFKARQGLGSPVRAADGLPPLDEGAGFSVTLRAGIKFADSQLTDQGWYVDTDAVEKAVKRCAIHLSSAPWTQLFDYRPTFELVAKWVYGKLEPDIPKLYYVELDNTTLAVKTRYQKL
jgi:hypothetical protein